MKESMNQRDQAGLGPLLPSARFILSVLGMLTANHSGHELNLLLNGQTVALVQTLVRLIGPEYGQYLHQNGGGGGGGAGGGYFGKSQLEIYSIFEDMMTR